MIATSETLEQLASRSRQLYSLPAVAMRVLELTGNPQVDTRALKECIENDPALTVKVLRVVNSSLFGLSRVVSDLNQALTLLGTKPLKLLVLGFSLPPGLFQDVQTETLTWYWRHTLTRAVAAREISEDVWRQPGDEVFLVGLLRDLGMLAMIQEIGPPYLEFLNEVRRAGGDLVALESESLGFNHTALTATLLAQWHLPENLVAAVCPDRAEQCGPLSPAARRLAEIVELADLVAQVLVDGRTQTLEQLLEVGLRDHGLRQEQLSALVEDLEGKVRQLADVLSLRLPEGAHYVEVLRRAQTQLAQTAAEVAEDLLAAQRRNARGEQRPPAAHMERLSAAVDRAVSRPAAAPGAAESTVHGLTAEQRPCREDADTAIQGRLTLAVAACRHGRRPLSLLLTEFLRADALLMAYGPDRFFQLVRFLEAACRKLDHPDAVCLPFRDAGRAMILADCERRAAVDLGGQLLDQMRRFPQGLSTSHQPPPLLSVGVASVSVPPLNFPPQELLSAAAHCLYASKSSGGGGVKSIEIY